MSEFENYAKGIVNAKFRYQIDFQKEFVLTTDASNECCIGSVLSQRDETDKRMMIHVFSEKLSRIQMNYSITDKELLGVVRSIEYFKNHLLGQVHLGNGSQDT